MNHLDPASIHKTMSRIKGKDTGLELKLRKALREAGLPYRLYSKKLPGHPDLSCQKYRIAIFCDSEFWHGYLFEVNEKKLKWNRDFWLAKIKRNMERDLEVDKALKGRGYTVLRFWGRMIEKDLETCVKEIKKAYEANGFIGKKKTPEGVID